MVTDGSVLTQGGGVVVTPNIRGRRQGDPRVCTAVVGTEGLVIFLGISEV